MIYSRFINQISSARQPSLIREMTRILAAASKEMIPLSGGFPNPAMFPFTNITVSVPNTAPIELSGPDLTSALQYLPTNGHPGLLQQLRDLQQAVHQPQPGVWDNSDIVITSGSQDGLCKAFEMMMSHGKYNTTFNERDELSQLHCKNHLFEIIHFLIPGHQCFVSLSNTYQQV